MIRNRIAEVRASRIEDRGQGMRLSPSCTQSCPSRLPVRQGFPGQWPVKDDQRLMVTSSRSSRNEESLAPAVRLSFTR